VKVFSAMQKIHQQEGIKAQLAEAVAISWGTLSEPEMDGLADRLPEAPVDALGLFKLLSNYPGAKETAAIQRINDVVNPDRAAGLPSVRRVKNTALFDSPAFEGWVSFAGDNKTTAYFGNASFRNAEYVSAEKENRCKVCGHQSGAQLRSGWRFARPALRV
jgi:hypothetical protein